MRTESELGVYLQVMDAYKQWVHHELAQCKDRDDVRDFFLKNWLLTQGTLLMPTALADNDFLRYLCHTAGSIEILFPDVFVISLQPDVFPDLNTLDLFEICRTHIISDNFKYLLPVKLICTSNDIRETYNPYYNFEYGGEPTLSKSEWQRIYQHNNNTQAYHEYTVELLKLKEESNNLLYKLELFCKQLKHNDAYHNGRPENAASGAYPAIIQFFQYYLCLDEAVISQIPEPLRESLKLLLTYSTDAVQNYNATQVVGTCIAVRRFQIENAIKGHEKLLESISILGEQKNSLIDEVQSEIEKLYLLISSSRFEAYEKYGFTQKLLEELKLQLQFSSFEDLQLLTHCHLDEFIYVCQNYPIFNFIANLDEFIEFSRHLSPEKLRVICSQNLHKFIVTDEGIHEWFVNLNLEQQRSMLEELIITERVWRFTPYIASLDPKTFIDILNHSSMDEKIRICTQKSSIFLNILCIGMIWKDTDLVMELLAFIKKSLPIDVKIQILCESVSYDGVLQNILLLTMKMVPHLLFNILELIQELPLNNKLQLLQAFDLQDLTDLMQYLEHDPYTMVEYLQLIKSFPVENQEKYYKLIPEEFYRHHLSLVFYDENYLPLIFEEILLLPSHLQIKFFKGVNDNENQMYQFVLYHPKYLSDFLNTIYHCNEDNQIAILTRISSHLFVLKSVVLGGDLLTIALFENYEFFSQLSTYLQKFSKRVQQSFLQFASETLRENLYNAITFYPHLLPQFWEIYNFLPLEYKINIYKTIDCKFHPSYSNIVFLCAKDRIEFLSTIFDAIKQHPEPEQQKIYEFILNEVPQEKFHDVGYMRTLCEVLKYMPIIYKINLFGKSYSFGNLKFCNLVQICSILLKASDLVELMPLLMLNLPEEVKMQLFTQEFSSGRLKFTLCGYESYSSPKKLRIFFNEIKKFPSHVIVTIFQTLAIQNPSTYYRIVMCVLSEFPELIEPLLVGMNAFSGDSKDLVFTACISREYNNLIYMISNFPEYSDKIYEFIELLDITTQKAIYTKTYNQLFSYHLNQQQQINFCRVLKQEYLNNSLYAYLFPESLEGKDYNQMKKMIGFSCFHYLGYCIRLILEFIDTYITPFISKIATALEMRSF